MSEWKEYKLGDIVSFSSGGTPSKSNEAFWGGNIPWISASSMEGYTYSDSALRITELGLKNGSRLAPKNSILLLVRGSILHQKIQVGIVERDVSFNQDVKCLQPKEEIIDPWFLLFWFKSEEKNLLNKVESTGIGAGKLDTPVLKELLIKVPPIHERKKLIEIFKAIQRKIELNREMNQTLEAIAQALFKSWFVDFDPVFDNALAAGTDIPDELQAMAEKRQLVPDSKKLLNKNPELADRFPSSFVFNERLGKWIPEGWEVKKLDKISKVKTGFPFKSQEYSFGEGIKVIRGENVSLGFLRWDTLKTWDKKTEHLNEYWLSEYDIVIGMDGSRVGRNRSFVHKHELPMLLAQRVASLSCREEIGYAFLGQLILGDPFERYVESIKTGTSIPHISAKQIKEYEVLVPSNSLARMFSTQFKPSLDKQSKLTQENQCLTQLRDRLLPELISGKVRVKEEKVSHKQL